MFLSARPLTLEDFFKSVNFIAPQGYTLEYFITPATNDEGQYQELDIPTETGYVLEQPEPENNVEGVTDTLYYTKKNMDNVKVFSPTSINLSEVPTSLPSKNDTLPQQFLASISMGSTIKSPEIIDRRTTETEKDLQITEAVGCFPKHTLFHFVKD